MNIFILIACLTCSALHAQVQVNNKIVFTSADSTKNTIEGLAFPLEANNALNTSTQVFNSLIFDPVPSGTDTIHLVIPGFVDSLKKGMVIKFKASASNSGSTKIKVNQFNTTNLKNPDGVSLKKGQIANGSVVCVVFNGTDFIITNLMNADCPAGFTSVNSRLCIETNEHGLDYFLEANTACASLNSHLCTWGEWYYACAHAASLGLLNMTGNYEFVDSGSDHTSNVLVIGGAGCTTTNNIATTFTNPTYKRTYRCCFVK